MKKKVLTLDDLYSFFEQRNQTTVFSAKESGYNIAVQVPAKFELEDSDEDDGFLRTKFKVNHKIDSRFAVSGDLELRTEDDMSAIDRWGISVRLYTIDQFWPLLPLYLMELLILLLMLWNLMMKETLHTLSNLLVFLSILKDIILSMIKNMIKHMLLPMR